MLAARARMARRDVRELTVEITEQERVSSGNMPRNLSCLLTRTAACGSTVGPSQSNRNSCPAILPAKYPGGSQSALRRKSTPIQSAALLSSARDCCIARSHTVEFRLQTTTLGRAGLFVSAWAAENGSRYDPRAIGSCDFRCGVRRSLVWLRACWSTCERTQALTLADRLAK